MLFESKIKVRSPYDDFKSITLSLFMRDISLKFGEFRGGFLFALLEPIAHILTFSIILGRSISDPETLVRIPVFVMTGLIPFLLFRNTVKSVMTSCKQNKAAFFYPKIKPYHAVASKALYETFIYSISFVIILSLLVYFSYLPEMELDAVILLLIFFSVLMLGLGSGLTLMVLRDFIPSVEKWVNLIFRPLYFFSAIFYSVAVVPHDYRFLFKYNPCVHMIEFTRYATLGDQPVVASFSFLLMTSLLAMLLGLILYTVFQDKLRSS